MNGLKLTSIYGLKPHELGFCGPQIAAKQQILRGFILGQVSELKMSPRGAFEAVGLFLSDKIKP